MALQAAPAGPATSPDRPTALVPGAPEQSGRRRRRLPRLCTHSALEVVLLYITHGGQEFPRTKGGTKSRLEGRRPRHPAVRSVGRRKGDGDNGRGAPLPLARTLGQNGAGSATNLLVSPAPDVRGRAPVTSLAPPPAPPGRLCVRLSWRGRLAGLEPGSCESGWSVCPPRAGIKACVCICPF